MNTLTFRNANENDIPLILTMIRELADYENLLHEVKADEDILRYNLFERRMAEVIFPVLDGKEIGFALFFHNFSTFLGKPGIYIEDLYIRKEYRGKPGIYIEDLYIREEYRHRGYGKALIEKIKEIARERECGRVEWWCLDSNTPSIRFYKNIGAEAMTDHRSGSHDRLDGIPSQRRFPVFRVISASEK